MTHTAPAHVAVIGTGIAGLACARALVDADVAVALFDKARGPGGRMASRRRPGAIVDLGAQAFTARDPAFAAELETWRQTGCAAPWPTRSWRAATAGWQRIDDGPGAQRLQSEQGETFGPYTQVVVAVPPPQAKPLVQPWDNALGERCQRLEQRA